MWEKLKSISQHPAAKAFKTFCGDPVQLYAVFLIMTAMHYYHEAFSWLYTLLALGISFVLMRFYDFVAKKRFLGPVCYLIYMAAGLYLTNMVITYGEKTYPISFFVWFLTPQDVVDFSLPYTIAIYMLMIGFLTSTVYYFAQIRYRMVMQLIIMLIPLSLYAKEDRHMPALLVILLLSSFFLLMVYCRQLKENKSVCLIDGFHSGVSIVLYVAAFSVAAAIIPKPQFRANREFIDNAMSYSTWSDFLMNAISMFTDTTNNFVSVSNNARTLYYVYAPESIRLRTQTYTFYKNDDSWNVDYTFDRPDQEFQEPLTYRPRDLTQAILDAATVDPEFAETYHLSDLTGITLPQQQDIHCLLDPAWYNVTAFPTPTRTRTVESGDPSKRRRSANNTIAPILQRDGGEFWYYPDSFARSEQESKVLKRLQHDTYADLLRDAEQILRNSDADAADLLQTASEELQYADTLLKTASQSDYHSEAVEQLAAKITAGLDSDLEKALAIERYFTEEGYVYDLAYQKSIGENVDTFLNTTHIGVCYEYATAMTLMCRSIGLPARYTQGFNLHEMHDERFRMDDGSTMTTNYVIKMRDAHAFPEIYISGYGWVSFEPTVASNALEKTTAENQNVMRWGYVLLLLSLLIIGIVLSLPWLREQLFRRNLPGMEPSAAASAAFARMRRTLQLSDSVTVRELWQRSSAFFPEQQLFTELDTLLYDPAHHSSMTSPQLAEAYTRWQAQRKVYEKEVKKLRKEQKKTHVNT